MNSDWLKAIETILISAGTKYNSIGIIVLGLKNIFYIFKSPERF